MTYGNGAKPTNVAAKEKPILGPCAPKEQLNMGIAGPCKYTTSLLFLCHILFEFDKRAGKNFSWREDRFAKEIFPSHSHLSGLIMASWTAAQRRRRSRSRTSSACRRTSRPTSRRCRRIRASGSIPRRGTCSAADRCAYLLFLKSFIQVFPSGAFRKYKSKSKVEVLLSNDIFCPPLLLYF